MGPWPKVSLDRLREAGNQTNSFFVTVFLGYYQYWPGGFMGLWFLCPGTPKSSTGSGSGFKASQKPGPQLKVSSNRLGIEPATPALQDIGLSPTPRRLLQTNLHFNKDQVKGSH